MNRIYQGKVTQVEILKPSFNSLSASLPLAHPMGEGSKVRATDEGKGEESKPAAARKAKAPDDWQPLEKWEDKLWQHHELFQDAVN